MPCAADDLVTSSPSVPPLVAEVRRRLDAEADHERAPAMQAYMKSDLPFRGVPATPLRRVCRDVFAGHRLPDEATWRTAVLALWDDAAYREDRYAAIELTGHRFYREFQRVGTLDLYRHLVVTGAWWDLVDGVAAHRVGPILRADPGQVTPVVRSWAVADSLWLRRAAMLTQLASKEQTDVRLLSYTLEQNLEGSPFGRELFIRKAAGWALREFSRTDPRWVLGFVGRHGDAMSGLTRREALRRIGSSAG